MAVILDYRANRLLANQDVLKRASNEIQVLIASLKETDFLSRLAQPEYIVQKAGENSRTIEALLVALDRTNAELALQEIDPTRRKRLLVIGSARTKKGTSDYKKIEEIVRLIMEENIASLLMQGGCGGAMEAAARGAKEGNATTVGCVMWNDKFVEGANNFDKAGWGIHSFNDYLIRFSNYDARKHAMLDEADAILVSATIGGGTLDEITDLYVQMQYGQKKPVVVYGDTKTAKNLFATFESMLAEKTISQKDKVCRDPSETGSLFFEPGNPNNVVNFLRSSLGE